MTKSQIVKRHCKKQGIPYIDFKLSAAQSDLYGIPVSNFGTRKPITFFLPGGTIWKKALREYVAADRKAIRAAIMNLNPRKLHQLRNIVEALITQGA